MSNRIVFVLLVVVGCSSVVAPEDQQNDTTETVTVDGSLRLTVSDASSPAGVLFAKPTATVTAGTARVTATRYGSQCQYAVTGRADVSATAISLRVAYSARLTSCVAEVRKLTYVAEISGLARHSYDLTVIHEENNQKDTLLTQRVDVP
ncbi:MAG: hypothetical protein V4550_14905 [Gemmatimonadota bacterium]